jgi:PKD repeat protein
MGVVAKIVLTTPLVSAAGSISAPIASQGVVTLEDYGPAPEVDPEVGGYGSEGTNYTTALSFNPLLENALKTRITTDAASIVSAIGDITVPVPTQAQIETFIADRAHAAVIGRGNIGLWTPTPPPDGDVDLRDVHPQAMPGAIAFCINDGGGADPTAITNFIPANRTCGFAIDGAKVLEIVDEQIHKPESEGGFGEDFPDTPYVENAAGHEARVTRLDVSLRTGSIHVEGDVTVVDAIAGSIDVDASFEAEVGLQFEDNPDGSGTQTVKPFTISEDVDLSLLAWILSFLLGFITFGIVGGIIALVIVAVVEGIAEKVGGEIIRDDVTGRMKGIGAWPQSLDGIGEVEARFENPILIDPSGILFADAYTVKATFASVTDALADANGPYVIPEGAEVQFDGGPVKPNTSYHWEFGDGGSANTVVALHRYADDGLRIAKLTTVVAEEGGVTTRHFAAVRVANVPATIDAGPPVTIDEGQVHEFVASYTDPGWPDTHRVYFDFGDDSPPAEGVVDETHSSPLGRGTARASHAYCDNGSYTVTVRVIDDDGGIGVDTVAVTVRNVAPTVEAGPDLFAYRCTPITLVARFTDPGWCDTHTGTWDFGDCTPPMPATVRERHDPPEGCGIVAATNRYECCGHFHAVVTVVDDDGGVGTDSLVVRVVDVVNGGFEDGFHSSTLGIVGNGWTPYATGGASLAPEQYVVHGDGRSGQRSQQIVVRSAGRAGIRQSVGANPGWDYQVSAWFHLTATPEGAPNGSRCRLGIDPAGGEHAGAATIVWTASADRDEWVSLAVRATAEARAITIFAEIDIAGAGKDGAARIVDTIWVDDVEMLPYPCPLGEAPPCRPPEQQELCVDWKDEGRPRVIGTTYTDSGFTFTAASGEPLRVVLWGAPAGQGKLQIPERGLRVQLPFAAARVLAHVWSGTSKPVRMQALGADGTPLGAVATVGASDPAAPDVLELQQAGIAELLFIGGGGEGMLVDLCIDRDEYADDDEKEPGREDRPTHGAAVRRRATTGAAGCGCDE